MRGARKKPYELWFRAQYKERIKNRTLRVALRPGTRIYPEPKGAQEGEIATVRIIIRPGQEDKGIQPIFDDFQQKVRIQKIIVKKIEKLTTRDLQFCLPDCQDKNSAKKQLEWIYQKPFQDDDVVSLIYFEYL
ncbi:MAG: hypothetical protein HYY55_00515 [Candidatus Niyogibacteria bacterium]|nr:MAG: hypothetical protein HYY55_00515 [Candidatus Niyogibacteria bacterium]